MVVSSRHGHDTQAAAYAKLRLITTIIFSSKGGTKTYRVARDAHVAWPFCRHETSWHFFSRGRCMPRGRTTALTIRLTPAQRQTLLAWERSTTIPAGLARRGRMILLLADGMTITDAAAAVGLSRRHSYKWIRRFVWEGIVGVHHKTGTPGTSHPGPSGNSDSN